MNIRAISLMFSCDCNLSCNYCIINKNNKENKLHARELQNKTVEALKDGTFLDNCLKIMDKFNQNLLGVEHLEFWGQETTLSLPYFTDHAEDWLKAFPNINHIMFSTNGTTDVNIVKDYIKKIDNIADRDIRLTIQYSYDGVWSTRTQRGADPDVILNNFNELMRFCEDYDFKHCRMDIAGHSVFSYNLLKYLYEDKQNIINYENELRNCILSLTPTKNKEKIEFGWGVAMELPHNTSKEEAVWLTDILKDYMSDTSFKKDKYSALGHLLHYLVQGGRRDRFSDTDSLLTSLSETIVNEDERKKANGCIFCSANVYHFKVMYDGTLITCQNQMYDIDDETANYKYSDDTFNKAVLSNMVKHHYCFNPLKDDEESYRDYLEITDICEDGSLHFQVSQVASLMLALAKANQIDKMYLEDKARLMADAFYIATKNVCSYNYVISTGSFFVKEPGFIRLMCNGIMDIVRDYHGN